MINNSEPPEDKVPLTAVIPSETDPEPNPKPQEAEAPSHSRSKWLWGATFLFILIGIAWIVLWLLYFQFHESTDDAYANGSKININATIPGSVISFYCDETQLVNEGQLIVSLDPTESEIILHQELAKLATTVLQVRQLYNAVEVNQANVESKKAVLSKAKFNYDNRLYLHDTHPLSVSNEDFIHSRDDYLIAEADYKFAERQLETALAAAGNTPLEQHSLIEQQKANTKVAYYNLQHCSIYAPATGYVAQRAVEVGQRVTPQMNLMSIIPTNYIWVDANYKETQLTYMRVGQPATVTFDMYGSKVIFEGKVLGIASGTGSIFSLIPPQNATGNWIKIVQRLPVRISLNSKMIKEYPIRLGITAEVDVDITNQNLPRLVQIAQTLPISSTSVFDLNLTKIDEIMDTVIKRNLTKESQELEDE